MKKIHGLRLFRFFIFPTILIFYFLSPLAGADTQRSPIDINLIIDGSASFSSAREEITSWVIEHLEQILVDGDRVTVWNTEYEAKIIYSGTVNSVSERDAVKESIRELSASGGNADYSAALREAARRQTSSFSYTLLINTSNEALNSVLESSLVNLLRYSRIEEFSSWRAMVVGLNIEARVRIAAAAFVGS